MRANRQTANLNLSSLKAFAVDRDMDGIGDSGERPVILSTSTAVVSNSVDSPRDSNKFQEIEELLAILDTNRVPGPQLLRTQSASNEFSLTLGTGAQARVRGPSQSFLQRLQGYEKHPDQTLSRTAVYLKRCVVKQLHSPKENRRAGSDHIGFALREVKLLCHQRLAASRVVKIQGWGLCLDSLERSFSAPRLPFLLLERADYDLAALIQDEVMREDKRLKFDHLRSIAEDVGLGLSAIHEANICHGDLKLENILIFHSSNEGRGLWTAKICDSGSAKIGTDKAASIEGPAKEYLGTDEWLPPEKHMESSLRVDLRSSDVFAYGLVVWAIFTHNPESPVAKFSKDLFTDAWGCQRYYQKAEIQIKEHLCAFNSITEPVQRSPSENASASSLFSTGLLGHTISDTFQLIARRFWSNHPDQERYSLNTKRVLCVLSGALDEDPHNRDDKPWRYLQKSINPSVLNVRPPPRISRKANKANEAPGSMRLLYSLQVQVNLLQNSLVAWLQRVSTETSVWVLFHLKSRLPVLRPGISRQRTYEALHRIFADLLGLNSDKMDLITHSETSPCVTLSEEMGRKLIALVNRTFPVTNHSFLSNLDSPGDHVLYSLSCIRSRFQPCCWNNILAPIGLQQAMSDILGYVQKSRCDEIAAWSFRGLYGDCLKMDHSYHDFLFEAGCSRNHPRHDDECITERMLILLDSDLFLGQDSGRGANMTVFEAYLRALDKKEYALNICQHFRRVAAKETAAPYAKVFYFGSIASVNGDAIGTDDFVPSATSSLHDAVRAGCYEVVEYLVRTGFNVTVTDTEGQTGLDLALQLSNTSQDKMKWMKIKDILLSRYPHESNGSLRLPLGWQGIDYPDGFAGYRETSVNDKIQSITFKLPRTGLLEARLLALAEEEGGKGTLQTYLFNPIRFLKATRAIDTARPPAADKKHNDEWFRQEIARTRNPEIEATSDDRRWYRATASAIIYLRNTAWRLFGNINILLLCFPLSIAGRFYNWGTLMDLIFDLASISISTYHLCKWTRILLVSCSWRQHTALDISNTVSLFPDALLGFLAVWHHRIELLGWSLAGSSLCNFLLILGASAFLGGLRYSEMLFPYATAQSTAIMGIIGPSICTLAYILDGQGTLAMEAVLISRASSFICLCAVAAFLHFRINTHDAHFKVSLVYENEEQEAFPSWAMTKLDFPTTPSSASRGPLYRNPLHLVATSNTEEDATAPQMRQGDYFSKRTELLRASTSVMMSLLVIGIVVNNLSNSLVTRGDSCQRLIAMFAFPTVVRFLIHPLVINEAYRGRVERSMDWTLGLGLKISLLVFPLWVIFGWIIEIPVGMAMGLVPTVVYNLSFFLLFSIIRTGQIHYLHGMTLLYGYIVLSLTAWLY